MAKYLFTVEWVSHIPTRGILLTPGVTVDDYRNLEVGNTLELRRPDGTTLDTHIAGFYRFTKTARAQRQTATRDLLLPQDIRADDVPRGTEVWLVD